MAMSKSKKLGAERKKAPAPRQETQKKAAPKAPGGSDKSRFIAPIFLVSLVLVFLGERVLATFEMLRYGVTGLGVLGAAGATAARFVMAQDSEGERRKAERALGLFSLGGLLALLVYFATIDVGQGANPGSRGLKDLCLTGCFSHDDQVFVGASKDDVAVVGVAQE